MELDIKPTPVDYRIITTRVDISLKDYERAKKFFSHREMQEIVGEIGLVGLKDIVFKREHNAVVI